MRVRYSETASLELEEIEAYIAADNLAAAHAVVRHIKYIIDHIGEFPGLAAQIRGDIHIFPTPPFPYLVFYTVGPREVIIRNIRHAGRMRP